MLMQICGIQIVDTKKTTDGRQTKFIGTPAVYIAAVIPLVQTLCELANSLPRVYITSLDAQGQVTKNCKLKSLFSMRNDHVFDLRNDHVFDLRYLCFHLQIISCGFHHAEV